MSNQPYVFISHATADVEIAREFKVALEAAGCQAFVASDAIGVGDNWPREIDDALNRCDALLLLLTEKSVVSDMVVAEVERARHRRQTSEDGKPVLAPVRVNFPHGAYIPYDLAGYIDRIQQATWTSKADTAEIVEGVIRVVSRAATDGEPLSPTSALADRRVDFSVAVPSAEPIIRRGNLPLASKHYIKRPLDDECSAYLRRPSAVVRIKAPRQMGKSSLLSRVLAQAQLDGYHTALLTMQLASANTLEATDRLCHWFCSEVVDQAGLPEAIRGWDDTRDPLVNCRRCFQSIVRGLDRPLLIHLDEADKVFGNATVATDFFGMLRGLIDTTLNDEGWQRLRIVIAHSTEAYNELPPRQSPFNIGLEIELPDLTKAEVGELAHGYGLEWSEEGEVAELMAIIGGHPYLIHEAIAGVATRVNALEEIIQNASEDSGPFRAHLQRHLLHLHRNPDLALAMLAVLSGDVTRVNHNDLLRLQSTGLVIMTRDNTVPRYPIYQRYFPARLHVAQEAGTGGGIATRDVAGSVVITGSGNKVIFTPREQTPEDGKDVKI